MWTKKNKLIFQTMVSKITYMFGYAGLVDDNLNHLCATSSSGALLSINHICANGRADRSKVLCCKCKNVMPDNYIQHAFIEERQDDESVLRLNPKTGESDILTNKIIFFYCSDKCKNPPPDLTNLFID